MVVNPHRFTSTAALDILGAIALVATTACSRPAPSPPRRADASPTAIPSPAVPPPPRTFERAALPVLDVHTHVDPTATSTILRLFDQRGIRVAVNLSAGGPGAGLEESLAQERASGGRILPFCTLPWRATRDPRFVPESVRILERCRALGVRGLKIPKVLGLGAQDLDGARLRVDAPRMDPVFAAAERLGMIVLIHAGDPRAFFEPATPANERWEELQAHPAWSFHGNGFPTFDEILTEFETRVLRHPNLVFIGAHFGNAAEDPDRVARLLARAPRYYIDTSARVPEFGRHSAERMRAFFLRWQDRIVFGTDLGLGEDPGEWMLGSHGTERTTQADVDRYFTATWRYYEGADRAWQNPTPIQGRWDIHPIGLPRPVLAKIYGANAARLLGIPWPPPN